MKFTQEFKSKFNEALDEYDTIRDGRGRFRLNRELDFVVIDLMKTFVVAFEQFEQDKQSVI